MEPQSWDLSASEDDKVVAGNAPSDKGDDRLVPLDPSDRLALENLYLRRQNLDLQGRLLAADGAELQRRLGEKYGLAGEFSVDLERSALRVRDRRDEEAQ